MSIRFKNYRIRDKELERIINELDKILGNLKQGVIPHADTHHLKGTDPLKAADIGAATTGQVNTALSQAKEYTDTASDSTLSEAKNYANTLINDLAFNQGGTTANRPSEPTLYMRYFDTDLNKPIWWNGSNWVDNSGVIV